MNSKKISEFDSILTRNKSAINLVMKMCDITVYE